MAGSMTVGELLDQLPGLSSADGLAEEAKSARLNQRCVFSVDEASPGDLVLGIGIGEAEAQAFVLACAVRRVAAVVLKDLNNASSVGSDSTVPLLCLDSETPWHAIVETVTRGSVSLMSASNPSTDLFSLVDAIALASGGSAIIEDSSRRVVAYSSVPGQAVDEERQRSILGRIAPRSPEGDRAYQTVWAANGVIRLDIPGSASRVATVVRAGTEPLGTIWVLEGPKPLSPDAEDVLARSITSVAWYLLAARRQARPHSRKENGISRALRGEPVLEGNDTDLSGSFLIGCYVVDGPPLVAARIADLASLEIGAPAVHLDNTVLTAVDPAPAMVPADRKRLQHFVTTIRRSMGVTVSLILSEPIPFGIIAPTAAEMKRLAASPAAPHELPEEVTEAEIRRKLLLSAIESAVNAASDFNDRHILALASKEPELANTLLSYFESHSDTATTAGTLGLHENTVRYRLRRIEQILGTEPRKLDVLTTLAQLKAWASSPR